MAASQTVSLTLDSPDDTANLAVELGARLTPGDTLLLEGSVGAGKTHFARALIQSLLPLPEDVPSPTFTLVQTYELAQSDIWHADLYRLTSTSEIEELGLLAAFETDMCLIEWPDRLGDLRPTQALTLQFADGEVEDQRLLTLHWSDPKWTDKLEGLAA